MTDADFGIAIAPLHSSGLLPKNTVIGKINV